MTSAPDISVNLPVEAVETLWGVQLMPAGCPVCKQVFLVHSTAKGQICPACVRGYLAPQPALPRSERPEMQIVFRKSKNDLLPILTNFVNGVWLRPDDFNQANLLQRAMPVYWPMWLVASDVNGAWQAEGGFDYQVKSSQESYSGGGWRTREVIETRIRWEPRLGQIRRHYDHISTSALSYHSQLWELIQGYRLDQSTPYNPKLIGDGLVQVPDLKPQGAWPQAKAVVDQRSAADCQKAAAAQHIRSYRLDAAYEALCWTQLLLPLYASYYQDDAGVPHPVFINGQSGAVAGERMASQRKGWQRAGLMALIAVGIFILGLLAFGLGLLFAPIEIIAIGLAILALGAGLGAVVPAVYPWWWNRRQKPVGFPKS